MPRQGRLRFGFGFAIHATRILLNETPAWSSRRASEPTVSEIWFRVKGGSEGVPFSVMSVRLQFLLCLGSAEVLYGQAVA